MRVSAVGIPWYARGDYPAIRRIMVDGDRLPVTFDAWLAKAQEVVQQCSSQGQIAVKVHVDPRTFPEWCRTRGLDVDAAARLEFANVTALRAYRELD